MAEDAVSIAALSAERIRLEREAFEIERSRLEAARSRAEAELRLVRKGHPMLIFATIAMLALLSFVGGVLLGISVNEGRHQRMRDARLREALSQISGISEATVTNAVVLPAAGNGAGSSRDVSVVVIQ